MAAWDAMTCRAHTMSALTLRRQAWCLLGFVALDLLSTNRGETMSYLTAGSLVGQLFVNLT